MDISLRDELVKVPDLRHQVRRLRWFRESFGRIIAQIGLDNGLKTEVNSAALTEAFVNWIEELGRQKSYAALDRRDFASFAAGLLLRELLRSAPVSVRPIKGTAPTTVGPQAPIVDFWPEGFLYTNYCLCVLNAIYEQEFDGPLEVTPSAADVRTWWSFRENVSEDPSLAIGFLDSFLGNEPNWTSPGSASVRPAIRDALDRHAVEAANARDRLDH